MENKKYLEKNYEYRGNWWLPNHPDDKIAGTVFYNSEQEIKLELDNSLILKYSKEIDFFSNIPLIYGISIDGSKKFTICDAREIKIDSGRGILNCGCFFCGYVYVNPEISKFTSAIVELSYLDSFIGRNPLKYKFTKNLKNHTLRYNKQSDIVTKILDLDLITRIKNDPQFDFGRRSMNVKYCEYLVLNPKKPQLKTWYLDVILMFRKLLSILVRYPVKTIHIEFETKTEKKDDDIFSKYHKGISYYQNYKYLPYKEIPSSNLPFAYSKIEYYWSNILNTWFKKNETLDVCSTILYGVLSNQESPIEFQFLSLLEAIESYQRCSGINKYLSEDEYKPIKEKINTSINMCKTIDSLKDSLKNKIKYGNEYSLRKRLMTLIEDLPVEIQDLITDNDNGFVSRTVDTRNYLIHRDETIKANCFNYKEMLNAMFNLKTLLEFCIIRDIGVPVDIIISTMTTHPFYHWTAI